MARAVSLPAVGRAGWAARLHSPGVQLVLAGSSMALLIGVLLVAPRPAWAVPPAPQAAVPASQLEPLGWAAGLIQLAVLVGMLWPFRPYATALRLLTHSAVSTRLLVSLTALVALAGVLIFPGYSSDLFPYATYERLWVVYGHNPLVTAPPAEPADWAAPWVAPNSTRYLPYGPLWPVLTWPIARLGGESPAGLEAGYKLLATAGYVACCLLIWATAEPARRQRALVLFAWSPLVLFTVLGKAHNDVLLAVGLLAMVWCGRRARGALGFGALIAASLVKASGLAAAPVFVVALWRQAGWRALVPALALGLGLAAVCYAPFWVGPTTLLSVWQQTQQLVWSPASVLIAASAWLPGGPYDGAVRAVLGLVWAVCCARLLRASRRAPPMEVAATSGWMLLVTLLLLTSAVYAHYFVPVLALVALAGDARLERLAFWLSVGGLAVYALDLLGLALGPGWLGSTSYRVLGSLVLLGPASLAFGLAAAGGLALRRPQAQQAEANAQK